MSNKPPIVKDKGEDYLPSRFRAERQRLGLSQEDVARLVRKTRKTVSNWEREDAERTPIPSDALEVLGANGMDVAYVILGIREGPLQVSEGAGNYSYDALDRLDLELLEISIEAAEVCLAELGRTLPPAKKAKLVGMIYDLYRDEGPEEIDKGKVIRLIDLAS